MGQKQLFLILHCPALNLFYFNVFAADLLGGF